MSDTQKLPEEPRRFAWGANGMRESDVCDGPVLYIREPDYDALKAQLAAAQKEAKELRELVKTAFCPNNCDHGAIPHHARDANGQDYCDWEQCQWCYERDAALDAKGEA